MGHPRSRPTGTRRGQALIMVVLLMFALVGLGGVFIAMINQSIVQTARAVDRAGLDAIAEAGLRYAEQQLLYSPDGADWRPDSGPDVSNPGWMAYGDGFYFIQVSYGRPDDQPIMQDSTLERMLKVDVQASYALPHPTSVPEDDPEYVRYLSGTLSGKRLSTRHVTAYLPLGLPDYLRWITNADGAPGAVTLGSTLYLDTPSTVLNTPDPPLNTVNFNPRTQPDDAQFEVAGNQASLNAHVPYLAVFNGPIRSETDLRVGNTRIDLTQSFEGNHAADGNYAAQFGVFRRDLLEVVGHLTGFPAPSGYATSAWAMVNQHATGLGSADNATRVDLRGNLTHTQATTVQTHLNNPYLHPLRAPQLDSRNPVTGMDRYRALTLGLAQGGTMQPLGNLPNAYVRYGEGGLYLYNPDHIQYNHNLAALTQEWITPTHVDPLAAWDNTASRTYDPRQSGDQSAQYAVEIALGNWTRDPVTGDVTGIPKITLRWFDGAQPTKYDQLVVDYPKNGVIFAEGNVIVSGTLPASLAFTNPSPGTYHPLGTLQHPGGWLSNNEVRYYVSPSNRRYDLTIVSGGTIYIDGHLPGPATRQEKYATGAGWNGITRGSAHDSKLALLAMDHVALNLTRAMTYDAQPTDTMLGVKVWSLNPADPAMAMTVPGTGDPQATRMRLLLRHAGRYLGDLVGFNHEYQYVITGGTVNGTPLTWGLKDDGSSESWAGSHLYFYLQSSYPGFFPPTIPNVPQLVGSELFQTTGGSPFGDKAGHPQVWILPSSAFAPMTPAHGVRGRDDVVLSWVDCPPNTTNGNQQDNDYLIAAPTTNIGPGILATGVDVQVDALVYAQRGHWFIIPGQYYDENATDNYNLSWPFPKYHEPQDVRVIVHGAIAENRPAQTMETEQWEAHWRGWSPGYFTTGIAGTGVPDYWDPGKNAGDWQASRWRWRDRRMGLEYHYDATLLRPACYTRVNGAYHYLPRLPKLPVSPNLLAYTRQGT